jgi:UDP-2,3-diacylglucosamine pyrophosphatase LpxH
MDFLHFAIENNYSICVNGDGVDLQQMSLSQLTGDLTACMTLFGAFARTGRQVFHTVGNHDIALEHFLSEFGRLQVVPFLNVLSGDQRIRVEHGHMYDGMFLKFPRTYSVFTFIGRMAIGVSPAFYERVHDLNLAIIGFAEYLLSGFKTKAERAKSVVGNVIEGERDCFREGAEDVGVRGFDTVIFGHTHLPGALRLPSGTQYYNTGGWFTTPYCVAVVDGRMWFGPVAELIATGDPFPPEAQPEQDEPNLLMEQTG